MEGWFNIYGNIKLGDGENTLTVSNNEEYNYDGEINLGIVYFLTLVLWTL